MSRSRARWIVVLMATALIASACAGSSDSDAGDPTTSTTTSITTSTTQAPAITAPPTTAAPVTTSPPDTDGDGIPDDDDPDDDGDGVPDVDDEFPTDPTRAASLVSQFPLTDNIAALPDQPSVEALRWVLDQIRAPSTSNDAINERFSPEYLSITNAAQVAQLIDDLRTSGLGAIEPLDVRVVSAHFLWVQVGDPNSVRAGADSRLLLINTDPNTGQISNFQASPSRLGLGTWQYARDTALTIDQAVAALGESVPNASILVAEVTSDGCLPIAGHQETVRRGIASLYKTWVLGALAAAVESGEISRDQVVTFTPGEYIAAGSNTTGQFEGDVEMTVQDAANLMMNVSDNGATDVLFELVGASAVNDFVRVSGHADPDTLIPVLTVSQFAHLFGTVSAVQVDIFTSNDEAAQLDLVASVLEPLGPFVRGVRANTPLARLSWQASPIDVCETFATMRSSFGPHTSGGQLIDEALGGEVFLFGLRNEWDRIWYKGGGHPGFATGTFFVRSDGWLVEDNDGRAFAVIAMYNPDEETSDNPFGFDIQSLYARIHQLLSAR